MAFNNERDLVEAEFRQKMLNRIRGQYVYSIIAYVYNVNASLQYVVAVPIVIELIESKKYMQRFY